MRITKEMIAKRLAKLENKDPVKLCRKYDKYDLIIMLRSRVQIAKCFGFNGIYVKEAENLLDNLHVIY